MTDKLTNTPCFYADNQEEKDFGLAGAYPEVAKKVRQEIDQEIEEERRAMTDKLTDAELDALEIGIFIASDSIYVPGSMFWRLHAAARRANRLEEALRMFVEADVFWPDSIKRKRSLEDQEHDEARMEHIHNVALKALAEAEESKK